MTCRKLKRSGDQSGFLAILSRPIFCISHIIVQDGFSGLSGLEGEFQGLYLWYIVEESQNLRLKRQNSKKTALVSTSFQLK